MKWLNRSWAFGLCCFLMTAAGGYGEPAIGQQFPEEVQQLVAPIALHPDQETVTMEGPTIASEPANPDVVDLPEYDPRLVYRELLDAYPEWVGGPGVYGPDPHF